MISWLCNEKHWKEGTEGKVQVNDCKKNIKRGRQWQEEKITKNRVNLEDTRVQSVKVYYRCTYQCQCQRYMYM